MRPPAKAPLRMGAASCYKSPGARKSGAVEGIDDEPGTIDEAGALIARDIACGDGGVYGGTVHSTGIGDSDANVVAAVSTDQEEPVASCETSTDVTDNGGSADLDSSYTQLTLDRPASAPPG